MTVSLVKAPAVKGTMAAGDLVDALKSCSGFASTDLTLPVLNSVQLVADGDTLTVHATDRYVAGKYRIGYQGEAFTAVVRIADVKVILNALKADTTVSARRSNFPVDLALEGNRLKVSTYSASLTVPIVDYADFPKLDALYPDPANASLPDGYLAFDPARWVPFTKVVADKHEPMKVFMYAPNKLVLITIGEHFTGLHMPMRTER